MSWAMRRRILYALGVLAFFSLLIGIPLFSWYTSIPPTCTNGKQDQGETAPDLGGPCRYADPAGLAPSSVIWARAFKVRDGQYNAAAYIQNTNDNAGVGRVAYRFKLYDSENVLVAERTGSTFVMPGGITPVFETNIDSGNRVVTHTFLTVSPDWKWEHLSDTSKVIKVNDRQFTDITTMPHVSAVAKNTSVSTVLNVLFVAVVFDTAGNAFAASASKVDRLAAGEDAPLVFTWPAPFPALIGRVDIIPLLPPAPAWTAQ